MAEAVQRGRYHAAIKILSAGDLFALVLHQLCTTGSSGVVDKVLLSLQFPLLAPEL